MSWTEDKVTKLKELWGKGNTASQIAEIIGGISRNAVIGKAHRLNLSYQIKSKSSSSKQSFQNSNEENNTKLKRERKNKFKSLIIEKDFEPENPKQLEELTDDLCKYPINHPTDKDFYFCGRSSLKDFSYCKIHLLYRYQQKNKK
jgi:GcrA cell cycle regulator